MRFCNAPERTVQSHTQTAVLVRGLGAVIMEIGCSCSTVGRHSSVTTQDLSKIFCGQLCLVYDASLTSRLASSLKHMTTASAVQFPICIVQESHDDLSRLDTDRWSTGSFTRSRQHTAMNSMIHTTQ